MDFSKYHGLMNNTKWEEEACIKSQNSGQDGSYNFAIEDIEKY